MAARSNIDIHELIDRIMDDSRLQGSSHFSERSFLDEPILITGSQMPGYLPDAYRKAKAVPRWIPAEGGRPGRRLYGAELFHLQGRELADLTDKSPYRAPFEVCFPTYDVMSDRQLRTYISWRTKVRAGKIEPIGDAYALVYTYELLCGLGVEGPLEAHRSLSAFLDARPFGDPANEMRARDWLLDLAAYHGLDPALAANSQRAAFDRVILELRDMSEELEGAGASQPYPCEQAMRLLMAVDELSTKRLRARPIMDDHAQDVAQVAAQVWVKLSAHYRKSRRTSLIESCFGKLVTLPHTMFSGALFFEPRAHADSEWQLSPLCTYRCEGGLWTRTCNPLTRAHNALLMNILLSIEMALAPEFDLARPVLVGPKHPKYLQAIIDTAVADRLSWLEAHRSRHIEVDLSRLAGIRRAAAQTREALLVDEERYEEPAADDDTPEEAAPDPGTSAPPVGTAAEEPDAPGGPTDPEADPRLPVIAADQGRNAEGRAGDADGAMRAAGPLDAAQTTYLRALLNEDPAARAAALEDAGAPEDLMVDAINEALFDELGDTAVEFGADGPQIIEDYREDLEGLLTHD